MTSFHALLIFFIKKKKISEVRRLPEAIASDTTSTLINVSQNSSYTRKYGDLAYAS
jgi:hypothetical protein